MPRAILLLAIVFLVLCQCMLKAQDGGLAPFTSATGRFMLFDHGRFVEHAATPPQRILSHGDRLVYVDHDGALRMFGSNGRTVTLDTVPGREPVGSGHHVAWLAGTALKVAKANGAEVLTPDVGDFTVQDSLVAYHDLKEGELRVWWRDRTITVARVEQGAEAPQWEAGSNTVVFHDRSRRRVSFFHRGVVKLLFDSTDMAVVAAGGDMVAYWDDKGGVFRVWDRGKVVDLEQFRPVSFKVGDGVLAYVTHSGAFKVYRGGVARSMQKERPTDYWVQDHMVLFVHHGRLWSDALGSAAVIERYVPEQWVVTGGTLTYLDLDRGIRLWSFGDRERIVAGMATERFERWGDVVLWKGPDGVVRCWWQDRLYEY